MKIIYGLLSITSNNIFKVVEIPFESYVTEDQFVDFLYGSGLFGWKRTIASIINDVRVIWNEHAKISSFSPELSRCVARFCSIITFLGNESL